MRFASKTVNGFRVYAVTGINTVSFGITATAAAKKKLLGFGVEREDHQQNKKYPMFGFKVFESVLPNADANTQVTTMQHPVQSFVWDDFTAKENRKYTYWFHPLRGKPKNLDSTAAPIKITIKTERLFSTSTHDAFFNRGVASSQAYTRKFGNQKPDKLAPAKQKEARQWLSRHLDDALLKFIDQAKKDDELLCCFYEFRYPDAAKTLKNAIDRGVKVKIILDGKVNEYTDKKGKHHESFPREDNVKTVNNAGIPAGNVIWREARKNDIQHNKFMVLLRKPGSPGKNEVWTGSANLSDGGIHGQTNVGHWVRDDGVAKAFADYWHTLESDPGAKVGDDAATTRQKNDKFRRDVDALCALPATIAGISQGVTAVFSPRKKLDVLTHYVELLDTAPNLGCITLAFGINKLFKDALLDNNATTALTFVLLEKEDKASKNSTQPFLFIGAKQNVYKAWGSFLREPLYRWAKETNARALEFNSHVAYVHSKFLLRDPLGADPIVVTGSANFSDASTTSNDENMLIIRGDQRTADIYFTEFNRIFNHYYFRSVVEATKRRNGGSNAKENLFLREKAEEWLVKYKPGTLRSKRLKAFEAMQGIQPAP